jgi:excinuclease UvrABC ATPase subunit
MFTNESFWKGFEEFLINNKTEQDLQTFQKLSQNMDDFEISFIEHIKNTSFDRVSKNITDRFTSKILPTETISTINMSANSINQITTSSGQHGTLLDFEIENELQRLLKLQNSSLENNVIEALNNFFNETNKTVKINNQELKVYLTPEREISFKHLSSGERQVIYIFLKVANATKDNALILMDEPEISLHLAWQEKLISEIRKVNDKSQLIIVTHSPAIVMNGWMDSFIDINDIFVGE